MANITELSNNLSVKRGPTIKIKLDGFELKNVIGYNIKSSTHGRAELTVTMLVNFPLPSELEK